jgi:hypothetical protein
MPWSQPLGRIRAYLGEKITLYFAFIGHYTTWLMAPAILGIIPFVIIARQVAPWSPSHRQYRPHHHPPS